jgi:hypothetical protein
MALEILLQKVQVLSEEIISLFNKIFINKKDHQSKEWTVQYKELFLLLIHKTNI